MPPTIGKSVTTAKIIHVLDAGIGSVPDIRKKLMTPRAKNPARIAIAAD